MKITTITHSFSTSFQLRAYENLTLGLEFEAQLDEGEKPEEVIAQLHSLAHDEVARMIRPVAERRAAASIPLLLGLPYEERQNLMAHWGAMAWFSLIAPELVPPDPIKAAFERGWKAAEDAVHGDDDHANPPA